jgi:hypothetical protein
MASADGYFYMFDVNTQEGGQCKLLTQASIYTPTSNLFTNNSIGKEIVNNNVTFSNSNQMNNENIANNETNSFNKPVTSANLNANGYMPHQQQLLQQQHQIHSNHMPQNFHYDHNNQANDQDDD